MELPVRHITIRHSQWSALHDDVWSDKFVEARLTIAGRTEPIKIRLRGGHTRDYPKKSFEIMRGGQSIHLNAEYDDPSMIRNALSFRFFGWIRVPAPKTKHCLLFINGQSMGVYLEIEAVDRSFFRRRGLSCESIIYAVDENADFSLRNPSTRKRKSSLFSGYELKSGTDTDRKKLQAFIASLNALPSDKLYPYLQANLDVDNYLRWLAGAVFTGNYDGFDQNYALYRSNTKGCYRIVPWDYEGTWGRNCYGKKCGSDLVRVTGYNVLTNKLLANKSIRSRYKQILREGLSDAFTLKRLAPVIEQLHTSIAPAIYQDSARNWQLNVFNGEPALIRNYIVERRKIISRTIAEW